MAIFDELRKNIKNHKIDKEREKRIKQEKAAEEQKKADADKRKLHAKIRDQYISMFPINDKGIIGMRRLKPVPLRIFSPELIEFRRINEKNIYFGKEARNDIKIDGIQAEIIAVDDALVDVCEALSSFIPRFADEYIDSQEFDWYNYSVIGEPSFNQDYVSIFADKYIYNKSNDLQKAKMADVICGWLRMEAYKNNMSIYGESLPIPDYLFEQWIEVIHARESFIPVKKENVSENIAQMYYSNSTASRQENNTYEIHSQYDAKLIAGEEGEADVRYALSWLPKEFKTIQGDQAHKIYIRNEKFRDEKQEFDHIVIGPNGLFLIETKNYGGKIRVDSDGNWTQEKNDGNPTGVRNPEQQVFQHEKLIRSIVQSSIPVISIICIANERTTIEGISNSKIPIVKSDRITGYIEDYNSGCKLTEELVDECYRLIQKYIIEDTDSNKRRSINDEKQGQIGKTTNSSPNSVNNDYSYCGPKDTSNNDTVTYDVQV